MYGASNTTRPLPRFRAIRNAVISGYYRFADANPDADVRDLRYYLALAQRSFMSSVFEPAPPLSPQAVSAEEEEDPVAPIAETERRETTGQRLRRIFDEVRARTAVATAAASVITDRPPLPVDFEHIPEDEVSHRANCPSPVDVLVTNQDSDSE